MQISVYIILKSIRGRGVFGVIHILRLIFKRFKARFQTVHSDAFSTITVQTSIDIRSDTIFISVLNIKITHWSWILPQIATKINNLTFDFYYMEYKLPFDCQKTLAIIFSSNLGCFNNLLRPNYWSQWPQ